MKKQRKNRSIIPINEKYIIKPNIINLINGDIIANATPAILLNIKIKISIIALITPNIEPIIATKTLISIIIIINNTVMGVLN